MKRDALKRKLRQAYPGVRAAATNMAGKCQEDNDLSKSQRPNLRPNLMCCRMAVLN